MSDDGMFIDFIKMSVTVFIMIGFVVAVWLMIIYSIQFTGDVLVDSLLIVAPMVFAVAVVYIAYDHFVEKGDTL